MRVDLDVKERSKKIEEALQRQLQEQAREREERYKGEKAGQKSLGIRRSMDDN